MDPRIRQLLKTIVDRYEAPLEEKAAELSNPAAAELGKQSPDELEREAGVRARAQELADAFAAALQTAAQKRPASVRLNSADAAQNRMADALIQFLVRPGFATVQTDETAPDVFAYTIAVDWPALQRVADEAGISLEEALRDQS